MIIGLRFVLRLLRLKDSIDKRHFLADGSAGGTKNRK